MGYDFRAIRVRQTAKALFDNARIARLPSWYGAVGVVPPTDIVSRPVARAPVVKGKGARKPSRMFQPVPIVYPEDKLRKEFYRDHPWELARPKIILEDSGNDSKHWDWSRIDQPGKALDGESVVQRQIWLMKHENLSKAQAYDKARREFYRFRHLDAIRRRVQKEEAMSTGAYFGKGPLEIGMQLEDEAFEHWKAWATKEIEASEAIRAQLMSGPAETGESPTPSALTEFALDDAPEEVPAPKPGGPL